MEKNSRCMEMSNKRFMGKLYPMIEEYIAAKEQIFVTKTAWCGLFQKGLPAPIGLIKIQVQTLDAQVKTLNQKEFIFLVLYIGLVVMCCSRHFNKSTIWIPSARRAMRALNPFKIKNASPSTRFKLLESATSLKAEVLSASPSASGSRKREHKPDRQVNNKRHQAVSDSDD